MADENQNNNQIPAPAELPSTHANIQIRTQESDVESLKQTGGAHPLPETIAVDSAPARPSETIGVAPAPLPPAPSRNFTWIFWAIGLVILFLIGYYVIPLFFG
jgi:hypothetical protein